MRISTTFLLVLFCIGLSAQQALIDSLLTKLESAKEDTVKVWLLNELGFTYASINPDHAKKYIQQGLALSKEIDWEKGVMLTQYSLGVIVFYEGDYELAKAYADKALKAAQKVGSIDKEITALNFLTNIYTSLNQLDSALYVGNLSLELCEQGSDLIRRGTVLFNIAHIQEAIGNSEIAKNYMLQSLDILKHTEDSAAVATVYQALATLTEGQESMDYNLKAMDYFQQTGNIQGQAFVYSSLGTDYYEMGDGTAAYDAYIAALELYQQLNFWKGVASTESNLGLLLAEQGRYSEAYKYLQSSRMIANELGSSDILLTTYRGLILYHADRQQIDSSNLFLDSMLVIMDTLFSKEKADLLLQAETKYQVKEREAEVAVAFERQKRIRRYLILGALGAILLLIILIQYLRNRQRIQQKEAKLALQLERAEAEKLKELDALKSNFFANISHEFRTPLTLILGPVRQALSQIPLSESKTSAGEITVKEAYLRVIERNALRLQNLVGQLLDLTKLDSGKMNLQLSEGNLLAFLRSLILSFESLAEHRNIAFDVRFPEQLKRNWFDADKLEKILTNLLSNAFKFTPENGSIKIVIEEREEGVQLQISDSGVGMNEEEVDQIFDRFYQVEGTEVQGTGIGLALVKELVQLYRGTISVSSQKGKGTTFIIYIPTILSAFKEEEKILSSNESKPADIRDTLVVFTNEHIEEKENEGKEDVVLIIEDNPDLRYFIADAMGSAYQVLTAENGKIGLEKAIADTPDLIISDVLMPEMNGFDLCEQLKKDERTSHIPVILLTAKASQADKLEGLEMGADDYLTKPFDREELNVRVKNLIKQRRQLQEKYAGKLTLHPSEVAVTPLDKQFLESVTNAIEANMSDESFSVEDLAAAVNFSRSQLHRKLKAIIGKNPNELIRNFRLARAKELLEKGAGNVSEVAIEVGYSSLSYFTSSFKKVHGVLPSEVGGR